MISMSSEVFMICPEEVIGHALEDHLFQSPQVKEPIVQGFLHGAKECLVGIGALEVEKFA